MICKYVYTTFKIKCIIAQVFASREKFKVTKLTKLQIQIVKSLNFPD